MCCIFLDVLSKNNPYYSYFYFKNQNVTVLLCTFILLLSSVPRLTVNVTTKDQSDDVLECNATTVRGVTSSATLIWKSNDREVDRADVSGTPMDNSVVFTHYHNILGELISTSTVYKCYVEINTQSKVNATGEIVISKSFNMCIYFYTLYIYCMFTFANHIQI